MEVALHSPAWRAQRRLRVDDASLVGEARRQAQAHASLDFGVEMAGKVALAATELANNLWRHAGGGELLMQTLGSGADALVELLALDKGPGMSDVTQCMRDGYSTAGTPGTGLGAVQRIADEFDIHSAPGEGTAVLARFGRTNPCRHGAVSVAVEGEIDCGDAWHVVHGPEGTAVMVVDGLGHGTFAAEAAHVAIEAFASAPFAAPQDSIARANLLMSKTRGGAAAIAVVTAERVSYAGLGNIGGMLISPGQSQGLVSQNGTLGMGQRRVQHFEYRRTPGDLLIMHSDGITGRWDLKHRADLLACHPALIAGIIYRDHVRGRDDATVVVVAP
jgi:anti-sigma regulatory factor (Ser/Thr protein kinase)